MTYVWFVGGGFIAIFAGWFLWNVFCSRRRRDPVADAITLMRATIAKGGAWKTLPGKTTKYQLERDGVTITVRPDARNDRVDIVSKGNQLSFYFREGEVFLISSDEEDFPSYHPSVRCNVGRARKALNAVRGALKLETYGEDERSDFDAELREKKGRADAHRAEIAEKLRPKKDKDSGNGPTKRWRE